MDNTFLSVGCLGNTLLEFPSQPDLPLDYSELPHFSDSVIHDTFGPFAIFDARPLPPLNGISSPQNCDILPPQSPKHNTGKICGICFDRFKTGKKLEEHAIELDHKTFVCSEPECGLAYCRRDSLSRHEALHTRGYDKNSYPFRVLQKYDRRLRRKQYRRKQGLEERFRNVASASSEHSLNFNSPLRFYSDNKHWLPEDRESENVSKNTDNHVQNIEKSLVTLVGKENIAVKLIETTSTTISPPAVEDATQIAKDLADLVLIGADKTEAEAIRQLRITIDNLDLDTQITLQ